LLLGRGVGCFVVCSMRVSPLVLVLVPSGAVEWLFLCWGVAAVVEVE
jgi:hypothetical protein